MGNRTVNGDNLDDWILGLAHETHYITDFNDVELNAQWRASDNPFTLDCTLALRSEGIDVPLANTRVDASLNRSEQTRAVYDLGTNLMTQMEAIYSRIYARPVDFGN
jgi:hypothetical protein